jgi:hypothetical protein
MVSAHYLENYLSQSFHSLCFFFSSPELAQGELLGSVNVRRPSSVVRPQLLVNTLAVAFLPQSSSNLVRMLI